MAAKKISLFVGNVSKNISQRDLEHEFGRFGHCSISNRGSYAFVEYEDIRDAEDAKMVLNNKNLGGLNLNIEWSKRSGQYTGHEKPTRDRERGQDRERGSDRGGDRGSDRDRDRQPRLTPRDDRCFTCRRQGHVSKDCPQNMECFECGGKGHFARECNRRKRSRSPRAPSPKLRSPGISPCRSTGEESDGSYSLEYNPLTEKKEYPTEDVVFPSDKVK